MRFFKLLFFVLALFAVHLSRFTKSAAAANEFMVDSTVTYEVFESGKTLVTHDITLENNLSTLYATSYSLSLENISITNAKAYTENGSQLPVTSEKNDEKITLKIDFPDAVVGKGKQRHFFVSYENTSFAVRTGEVWEISIPRLNGETSFRNYTARLVVPEKFGLEAYVSPKPAKVEKREGVRVYSFKKEDLAKTGVTAGFGDFQVFTYTLNYHLENPLNKSAEAEIAVPPDTAFQRVYLREIEPKPKQIKIDPDGNWLAIYLLKPRERLEIKAAGEVQIFSSERPFPQPSNEILDSNLRPSPFWQVDDPEIKALAAKLKTPRAIYDYIATTLKYDYTRVRPNVERLGAKGALLSPSSAICMEFTDLFIAIARAAGIPAREINGYAYTENPQIQPLSLVADVLHSWPEYWDENRGAWIPIDPTWAATTGGVNFFDKLDLRHFTFVIHGKDPQKPFPPGSYKLGANPQKDVFVSFGKLPSETANYPEVNASLKENLPFINSGLNFRVENKGKTALYQLKPQVYFDEKLYHEEIIEALPPFSAYENNINVPSSFLGKNIPAQIRVEVNGSGVILPTNKNKVVIMSILGIFCIFIIILTLALWKNRHLNFPSVREFIFSKIKKPPFISERQ